MSAPDYDTNPDKKINGIGILKASALAAAIFCLLVVSCQIMPPGGRNQDADTGRLPGTSDREEKNARKGFQFENDGISSETNIHYTGKYCNECHVKTPEEGGSIYLKFDGDYGQLCRCHGVANNIYIHPMNIVPTPEKKDRMPADFPLERGMVTCLTCHDIYLQCQKRLFNRNSLRGAPYPNRTDFCYNCHVRDNYTQRDPHLQLNESGEIVLETCLICHGEKPDEKHATFKDVTFIGDIELMCRRCHHIAGNHSGNADHMGIRPSAEGLRRIKAMEEKYHVRLPLDEKGKMTCITCHNPHARGVIPEDSPGSKGADSQYRHRLPENLCKECHQM